MTSYCNSYIYIKKETMIKDINYLEKALDGIDNRNIKELHDAICGHTTINRPSMEHLIMYAHTHWVACLPSMNICQNSTLSTHLYSTRYGRDYDFTTMSDAYHILKCGLYGSELIRFVDVELGIDIIGASQFDTSTPIMTVCMEILKALNIRTYITLNEQGIYIKPTRIEKDLLLKQCHDCTFFSIPVEDYQAPSGDALLQVWGELDFFHSHTSSDTNILIHCTGGKGRTGFMIMSYIWYKKFLVNRDINKDVIDILLKAISADGDIDYVSCCEKIIETEIVIDLYERMEKYSLEAQEEMFDISDTDKIQLFFDRINVIVDTMGSLRLLEAHLE